MSARTGAALADGLSDLDRAVLDLEGKTFRHLGAKERAIRETTSLRPSTYFVHLNGLLDRREALAYAPAVVNRLRACRGSARSDEGREGGDGGEGADLHVV